MRERYNELYFQMLKEDKLELLEIYMNVADQLQRQIENPEQPVVECCLHHNIQTILMFEKFIIKSILFSKAVSCILGPFTNVLISLP